jgi:hypothetical protein
MHTVLRHIAIVVALALLIVAAAICLLTWAIRGPDPTSTMRRLQRSGELRAMVSLADAHFAGKHPPPSDAAIQAMLKRVEMVRDEFVDGQVMSVRFELGGADRHYGVIVTRTNGQPYSPYPLTRWESRVWFYSEEPQ